MGVQLTPLARSTAKRTKDLSTVRVLEISKKPVTDRVNPELSAFLVRKEVKEDKQVMLIRITLNKKYSGTSLKGHS